MDRALLVGGAGYWLANRDDDYKMWYGGLVVGWFMRPEQRIGFGVRGLAGGGQATLGSTLSELSRGAPGVVDPRVGGRGHRPFRPGWGFDGDRVVLVSQSFFVFEPQANVVWHVTRWCQVNLGAGYRVTAGADLLDGRLRGPSGSLAIQFGGR
jgi:hypothetical protein